MNHTNMIKFSSFPVLTTKRLLLRELRLTDAADVLLFRSDPHVQRYNGPVYQSLDDARTSIEHAHAEYQEQNGISWALVRKQTDRVIGNFSFHNWSQYHRRAEVGYDLARAHWGQGMASEALRTIIRFGFEQMNLNHIYAGTIADNHESVCLLEKVGFQRDGTRRKFSWEDDETFHDSAMYSLLRDEYDVTNMT